MAFYATLVEAIDTYTGLSPAAFFTILALMVGVYGLVSAMFVYPDAVSVAEKSVASVLPPSPPAEPVQIGDVTLEELIAYDGSDPKKPLLMAIKGQVYDVSRGRMFYGPGGPYALFAGRDASRALALMSFDRSDLTGNLEGLSSDELDVLQDWEEKFKEKYVKVGQLISENSEDKDAIGSSEQMERNQESHQGALDGNERSEI
ncbi:membrane steroid-binding protein 2-like [Typha angustifolia]|uniref:membrane steroid-binding protein 2-like n=1 Tax=Typha angustifolia TaxID=59011 RepID=UPI003C2B096E